MSLCPNHLCTTFIMGGPQLGELEAGVVAALFGVSFSVVSGGIITLVLTAWIASQYPALRAYRSGLPVGEGAVQ